MLKVNQFSGFGAGGTPQNVTLRPSSVLNWQDSVSVALFGETHGWSNFNMRRVFEAVALTLSGPSCRIVFKAGSNYPVTYDDVYFGQQAVSGDAYDMDGSQVSVTLNGSTTIEVPVGQTVASDRIALPLDETKGYVVATHVYDSPNDMGVFGMAGSVSGVNAYYGSAGTSNSATSDVSLANGPGLWLGISEIQVEVIDDIFFTPTVS